MHIKKHLKATRLLVVLFVFPGLLLTFSACENDLEKVKQLTEQSNVPLESAKNMEVTYSDSGRVKLKIKATRMDRFPGEKPYLEMTDGVEVLFYDSAMNVQTRLNSQYAISYEKEQVMEAHHDVVVVNVNGDKLNTEKLVWEQEKGFIHTDEFVKITTEDEIIYGEGLEANEDFTKYKILKPTGTINIKDE